MPLIELLLLLLLLLRAALLHRRGLPHQGMSFLGSRFDLLLLGRMEFAVRRLRVAIRLRLRAAILGRLRVSVVRSIVRSVVGLILGRRSSLLLVAPRLRLRQLPDLAVAIVRLTERFETVLRGLRATPWIHLSWP
jgi:hypothetical protein